MEAVQQAREEDEQKAVRTVRPEVLARVERGPPLIGEMIATYLYGCPVCKTPFTSQHPADERQQVVDMCPKCNEEGHKLKRVQRNTVAGEFAIKYELCHADAVRYDDQQFAYPMRPDQVWTIYRVPTSVRKKHGIKLGRRFFGVFGPLVVSSLLDAGDRQIMGALNPLQEDAQYEGTYILRTYLYVHGKQVAWQDSRQAPIPAYDPALKSPYVATFEYHRGLVAKKTDGA